MPVTPVQFLLIVLAAWLALAGPFAILIGAAVARGMGPEGTGLAALALDADADADDIAGKESAA
jgi:hypothetical protein